MNNFDWKYYISIYNDLKEANIDTEEKSLNHRVKH